ncbi:hypothetical protein [Candidatus Pristimantibacillus sp. PTI5]|uniref:hypothetical protein n=1 Tax=Candidatus Pristimantibacillus sp. PTI5 TaxID=3400422 RepID=UPI003B029D28
MPGGYTIQLPDGRSLNKDKNIQGDVDRYGQGGVTPDIRILLNAASFKAKYMNGQDVELDYALKLLSS